MPPRTTLPASWIPLVRAVGSVRAIYLELDLSQSSFHRCAAGLRQFPPEALSRLETLCLEQGVPNPLSRPTVPWNGDLAPLKRLGEEIVRLKNVYSIEQLTRLAESDGTPEAIQRAIRHLLED